MCGLAGIINFDRGRPVDRSALAAMADRMVHRGPDEGGLWAAGPVGLAHRRLSIIDLSPAAAQPMANEDGSIVITYNGEIYNFKDLRRDLAAAGHAFRSDSDTEVLIHGYEQYGLDLWSKLNGMFAMALWDGRKRKMILVRDRIGIKPLYYYLDSNRMVFASELTAIIHSGLAELDLELDQRAVQQFLIFGHFPAPLSIFKRIRKLEPGQSLVLQDGGVRTDRFWGLEYNRPAAPISEEDCLDRLEELLTAAVKRRLISDVPLGCFLSGGVDSTCVAAIAARLVDRPLETFTIGFEQDDYDESEFAVQAAAHLGCRNEKIILNNRAMAGSGGRKIMEIMGSFDEPMYDSSAIPTYYVSQLARRSVTVALSGDGGDELFFGYVHLRQLAEALERRRRLEAKFKGGPVDLIPSILAPWLLGAARRLQLNEGPWGEALEYRLFHQSRTNGWPDYFVQAWARLGSQLRRALTPTVDDVGAAEPLREMWTRTAAFPEPDRLAALDLLNYLPNDILTKVDRMSMIHSLEARVPLLDHTVVEFAMALPLEYKWTGGCQKHLLRRLAGRLLENDQLAAAVCRPKHGFSFPIGEYALGELWPEIETGLTDKSFHSDFRLSGPAVRRELDRFRASGTNGKAVWLLFCLYLWYRRNLIQSPTRPAA